MKIIKLLLLPAGLVFLLAFSPVAPSVEAAQGRGKGKDKGKVFQRVDKRHRTSPDTMKHRGIDRNGDGIITRREWPGNDQSFSNHDRNGDGILAGRELQPGDGARSDRSSGLTIGNIFRLMDSNDDGVVSRFEFSADRDRFDRIDANHDGVITRGEFERRQ